MSLIYDNYSESSRRTPSPGIDYESLLNNSSTNQYSHKDLEDIRKYSPISPEIEESSELNRLRGENQYLQAQLEIAIKEKDMHIKANAQERVKSNKEFTAFKESTQAEIIKIKRENEFLINANKELIKKISKMQKNKKEKTVFYKRQLENQEKHYTLLLNEKAMQETKEPTRKKGCKGVGNKVKKMSSLRSSTFTSKIPSPRSSTKGILKPIHKLDEISQLIVKLEKEQAELKQTANGSLDISEYSLKIH